MGAQASTTSPADFANRRTAYLERKMLETLMYNLRLHQFADKKSVPAKGTSFARFFRAAKAKRTAQNLTEGVQNLNKTQVGVGNLDCYFNQRGDDFEISDIAEATDVLDTLRIYMKTIGNNAALDYDFVMWASIVANATTANLAKALGLGAAQTTLYNSNNTYGKVGAQYFERFAGVVNSGNNANDFATLGGLSRAQGCFTRKEHLRAMTQLRANDVMPPDGKAYPVIVPPEVKFDIRQDVTLVAAMTYRDNNKLYKWEDFELDGGAFIESTNPWVETVAGGYGNYTAGGNIFTLLYLGDDAYGTVLIDDKRPGGSPAAPKIVILDKPDKSDRYNQFVAGSWKSFYGSILKITSDASDVPHVCSLRCQSQFQ